MKRLALVAFLLLATGALLAETTFDQKEATRTWKNPGKPFQTKLSFLVDDEDNPGPFLTLPVAIRVLNDAPLYPGELEIFRVKGYRTGKGGRNVHHVLVQIEPKVAYYKYPTAKKVVVVVPPAPAKAEFRIRHDGRIQGHHIVHAVDFESLPGLDQIAQYVRIFAAHTPSQNTTSGLKAKGNSPHNLAAEHRWPTHYTTTFGKHDSCHYCGNQGSNHPFPAFTRADLGRELVFTKQ